MTTLICRQCNKPYASCNDAIRDKDYKSFCCSEECYQAYIKIVLDNRIQPKTELIS